MEDRVLLLPENKSGDMIFLLNWGLVAELVYAQHLKCCLVCGVWVRVPPSPPKKISLALSMGYFLWCLYCIKLEPIFKIK